MAKSPSHMATWYDVKTTGDAYKAGLDSRIESMLTGVGFSQARLKELWRMTLGILTGETDKVMTYGHYFSFVCQVFSLTQRLYGTALISEVALALQLYVSRGLISNTLDKLRTGVFAIPAPGAP